MDKHLFSAHFQLTSRCNLSCRFCGQTQGMLAASPENDLPLSLWLRVADELGKCAEQSGERPEIMLWGGEPLLYEGFGEIAETLHARNFRLGVVTNGTLIDRWADVICRNIDVINVSVNGIGEVHDRVRGEGTFAKLAENLPLLEKRMGKLIFLTTITDENVEDAATLPRGLAGLKPDGIVFQQLMYLTEREIEEYRSYSRTHFGCDYPELEAWRRDDDAAYRARLADWRKLDCQVPAFFSAHVYPDGAEAAAEPCEAAWRRVHVRCDGEVGFCTDYFGFSAGNVRNASLAEIFSGVRAEAFRRAVAEHKLSCCNHCPWHLQSDFHFNRSK